MTAKMLSLMSIMVAIFFFQQIFVALNMVVVSELLRQRIEIVIIETIVLEITLLNQFGSCLLIKFFTDVI